MISLKKAIDKIHVSLENLYWNIEDFRVVNRNREEEIRLLNLRLNEAMFTIERMGCEIESYLNKYPEMKNMFNNYDMEV